MKRTSLFYFILMFSIVQLTAQVDSSSDVIYNESTDSINNYTYDLIKYELFNSTSNIYLYKIYCGPKLWERYSKIEPVSNIKKGNIEFQVPTSGIIIKKKGKLIQSLNDFNIVWNQIVDDLKNTKVYIRKLNEEELEYYWSIIFFDIEEPIYIVENEKHKFIMDFDKKGHLLFIEEYGNGSE